MADMEAVNAFNSELSSLYEVKPPISKGKMTSITKAALKAVKLYKHVVQSVEKFIQKCKPEYKIPGLYVIDSIIRQSRHQFGPEKDVFAVRFARNLTNTFVHLYKCPDEDKAKVIRVLNLWQKNKIFMPEVIAPLFDLANPNHAIWETIVQQQSQDTAQTNANKNAAALDFGQVHFKRELLEYDYDDDVEPAQNNDNREQSNKSHSSQQAGGNSSQHNIADKIPPNVMNSFDALGSLLANPEVLRQLQTLQEQMAAAAQQQVQSQFATPEQERQRKLAELNKQEAAFEQRLAQTVARLPFAVDCDFDQSGKPTDHHQIENKHEMHAQIQQQQQLQQQPQNMTNLFPPAFFQQLENNVQNLANPPQPGHGFEQQMKFGNLFGQPPPQMPPAQQDMMNPGMFSQFNNYNQQTQPPFYEEKFDNDQERSRRRRSRSPVQGDRRNRSRSRSKTRRRSRSGSRGRTAGSRKKSYRSRSRERREEKEKEKERARKGFPPMKKEHLSVCSTTLWVGHLSKLVSQEEISDTFGVYGDIVSIDVIPPRGCAFIVMNRRQDALRALDRLKNSKLQGKTITLAWAPGKGVKGREWKDYWEVDNGVSYIPWNRLKMDTDIDEFEDGGCIDEDTLPIFLKNRPKINLPDPIPEQSTQQENDAKVGEVGEPQGVPPPNLTPAGLPIMLGTPTKTDGMRNMGIASKPADVDNRSDMSAAHAHAVNVANQAAAQAGNQIPLPVAVPNHAPGMVQPFVGMPPQVGMMGMPNYGMMVPPPLMHQGPGAAFGPPPGGMMGMLSATSGLMNAGPGGPMGAGGPGAGLLGDMPMVHQLVHQQVGSGLDVPGNMSGVGGMPPNMAGFRPGDQDGSKRMRVNNDEELPARGISIEQSGQKRKKSRFDDPSSPSPIDDNRQQNQDLSSRNAKDDRVPLHERLKHIAEYGQMENARPSLLGNPQAPPPMTPMMGNNVFNNGLPQMPLGDRPRPGFIPSLFNAVGSSPTTTNMAPQNRMPGNPNWFDISNDTANPFVNPTSNPFVGNPFVQQSSATNPFDLNSSFEPLTNPNFNNDSPRGGGRGGWTGNRDGPPQGSPQKWVNNRGGGGGTGGAGAGAGGAPVPPGPNSWGRNDSRREEGRFQDNWRDNARDHRGGHRDVRESRSGERDRDRGRDRERDRSGRGDRRDSRDRSGGRDWRHDSRRGGRGNESGRDRSSRRVSGDRSDRGRSERNENSSGRNRSSERARNGETSECWDVPTPKEVQVNQREQEQSNAVQKELKQDDDIQVVSDTAEPTTAEVPETGPSFPNAEVDDAQMEDTQSQVGNAHMGDTQVEDTQVEDNQMEDNQMEDNQMEDAHTEDTQMEDSEFKVSNEADSENQREETEVSQTDEYDDSKPSATGYEEHADAEVEGDTEQVEAESQNQWNTNTNDSETESEQQYQSGYYNKSQSRYEEPSENFTANQNQDFSEDARQEAFEHSNEEAFNPENTSDSRVSNNYDEEAERDFSTQNDFNPSDFNSHKETDDWSQNSAPPQHDVSNENGKDEDSRRSFENNEEKHDKENYSEANDSNTKYTSFAPSYDNYSNECGQNSNSGDYETSDAKSYRRVSLSEEATNHKAEDNVNCESSYDNSYASAKNVQQDLDGIKDDQQSESNLHEIVTEEGTA